MATSRVAVFEDTKDTSLNLVNNNTTGHPIAAAYKHWPVGAPAATSTICFNYLIDTSSHAGLVSQCYLKNCKFNKSLNNIACWGY